MDILLLGGPKFLGCAVIDAALAGGHKVTMFNRGQTNAELYPEIERIQGDRDGGLDGLKGRRWDAVIDNSGYLPRIVKQSSELLAGSAGRYLFVSSISVYANIEDADENSTLVSLSDPKVEEISGGTYGGLKALCEQAVQEAFGDGALIVRPGLIVGRHDPTDRFTYWPLRASQGGRMVAPVGPEYPVQVIDVRDLAEWMVRLLENNTGGVFNATGPDHPLSLGEVIDAAAAISGASPQVVWKDAAFFEAHGVKPWSEVPMWQPVERWASVNIDRALAAGLTFRPISDTVADTHSWVAEEPRPQPLRAGLTAEREAELLGLEQEA